VVSGDLFPEKFADRPDPLGVEIADVECTPNKGRDAESAPSYLEIDGVSCADTLERGAARLGYSRFDAFNAAQNEVRIARLDDRDVIGRW
jgi:hypothetical protein